MEIRLLGPGDDATLAAAAHRFRNHAGAGPAAFLADPATIAFAAVADGDVAGWAWGHRLQRVDGAGMVLLYEIEVAPEWRRRGVGGLLLDAFLDLARREGHIKLWVVTTTDNEAALALYRAAGGRVSATPDAVFGWVLGDEAGPTSPEP